MPGIGAARLSALLALMSVSLVTQGGAARAAAAPTLDWAQYLHGPQHSSMSPAAAFTPSNAASAAQVWHWQPPVVSGQSAPTLIASPTVVGGLVYIGAYSGGFYALNEATGRVAWSRQLDTELSCGRRGIGSTAAVVADPVTGVRTVYVSGARFLYALNAATGALAWKTEIGPSAGSGYYNWSSPTVADGHIYVGLASACDNPLIRGGLVELDQHTGAVLHTWYTVPAGSIGGSIWSSVAVSSTGTDVWASTGNECDPALNACPAGNQVGHSLSIVHLSASLQLLQAWHPPGTTGHDWDFGSSPTLFGGTGVPPDVGACNKNGHYYALAANPLGSSPLWGDDIGVAYTSGRASSCLASSVWDAQAGTLFLGSNQTTIGATTYGGSVREVNPATGAYIWQTGLPCAVMGTPTLDGAGVLAAGTYDCDLSGTTSGAYLINASTGAILKTLPTGTSRVSGQLVFAQDKLFVATTQNGLYEFAS